MKLKLIGVLTGIFLFSQVSAQISEGGKPWSFQKFTSTEINVFHAYFQEVSLVKPNLEPIKAEDLQNDAKGPYRVGINLPVAYSPLNAGTWMELPNGNKVWRLKIKIKDALALGLYFTKDVQIPAGGKLYAYNANSHQVLGAYTASTPAFQALEMVEGESLTLEYDAPSWVTEMPVISIQEVVYFYRGVEEHIAAFSGNNSSEKAQSCEVDVACSEGTAWTNQINSVVHYTFNDGTGTYVCSASTINNTAEDCAPYILTAWHCGERQVGQSIATWVWYWKYQKSTCSPGTANSYDPSKGTKTMTGGTVRCSSGNGTLLNNPPGAYEVAGSDFYLVELNSQPPASYDVYYAGWNRTNISATNGVGIHHPYGSAKKISTYTTPSLSSSFNGGASGSHWSVVWSTTANGHGVTEGGSSGSPLFDQDGRIIGQLSGGGSACTVNGAGQGTGPDERDVYGKMYTSWDKNGTTADNALKYWLDPLNTGVSAIDGAASPCSPTPAEPVADFVGNPTTVSLNGTVQFTDLSTGVPSSWYWSITPATGWTYASGSNAYSQNPQVTFSTVGLYTVTLTASNSVGSDQEIKTNYITVTAVTGPCTASSTACDEFIQEVELESIDNESGCTNYSSYSYYATLAKGESYEITIIPQITGQNPGTAYTGDEIAAWIDFNGDFDFDDAGEEIAFLSVGSGSTSLVFPFSVPYGAVTGTVTMRVRIAYNADDGGEGPVAPCGTTTYGEVEDYTVILVAQAGLESNTLTSISVYPNPVSEELSIDLQAYPEKQLRIDILDITGKRIESVKVNGGSVQQLSTVNLARGIYQVIVSDGSSQHISKIIKQ